ncbi:NADH-quinone oxidoreductase subunit J [Nitrospira defluvii]|nr:NADH-quinone oxidoreductase subunit J [Nitrospira defluvii]
METIFFFYFSFVAIVSSIFTVGLRSPVYCTLSLLSTLLHVAGLFVLLHAEFIAAIQIIVYAGAVLVLYLFVLMLLNLKTTETFFQKQTSIAVFFGVVILVEILIGLSKSSLVSRFPEVTEESASLGNTVEIGLGLFNQYLLPFEVVGVILLGAVIGALVLAKKIPAR